MKLNYSDQYKATHSNLEFEQFKRKLLRQAGGFGVFYVSETPRSTLSFSEEANVGLYEKQPSNVLQVFRKSADFAGTVIQSFGRGLRGLVLSAFERYQSRSAIRRMLRLSDSALQDIGLERAQLETLGLTGGNISDYVSGVNHRRFENTGKLKTKPGLTLIDCSDFDRDNQRNLDRAA